MNLKNCVFKQEQVRKLMQGKVRNISKIKDLPDELRKMVEKHKFQDKFPDESEKAARSETSYRVYPDGKSCLFTYDERYQILIFSYLSTFYREELEEFVLTYSIELCFPHPTLEGKFSCSYFNCFHPFPFQFENKNIPETRVMSSKVKRLLIKAARAFPDRKKIVNSIRSSIHLREHSSRYRLYTGLKLFSHSKI